MVKNSTAPATKQDIKLLMQQMAKIYDHTTNVKEELKKELVVYIDKKMDQKTGEFKAYVGTLQRDFVTAMNDQASSFQDKTTNHEVRITRIEQRLEAAGVGA